MSNNKPPQKPSNNPKPNSNTLQFQSNDVQPKLEMKNAPARTGGNSQGLITQSQADILTNVTNELSPNKPTK